MGRVDPRGTRQFIALRGGILRDQEALWVRSCIALSAPQKMGMTDCLRGRKEHCLPEEMTRKVPKDRDLLGGKRRSA